MHFAVVQKEEEFFIPGYQITCQDAPAERGHSLINIFFLPLQLVIWEAAADYASCEFKLLGRGKNLLNIDARYQHISGGV